MRDCVVRVEFDGPLEFFFGGGPIPVVEREGEAQRGMSFRERAVNFERFHCRLASFRKSILWRQRINSKRTQYRIGVGQPGVGQRIAWVYINRLLKVFYALPKALVRSLIPEVTAFEIGVISLDVIRVALRQSLSLFGGQPEQQLLGYFTGDLRFDLEDV